MTLQIGEIGKGQYSTEGIVQSGTRRFHVYDDTRSKLPVGLAYKKLTEPASFDPPLEIDTFPNVSGMKLLNIRHAGGQADFIHEFELGYVDDTAPIPRKPDDELADDFNVLDVSFGEEPIEVPIVTQIARQHRTEDGTIITSNDWEFTSFRTTRPRTTFIIRASADNLSSTFLTNVEGEVGKLHSFGGIQWIFKGLASQYRTLQKWQLQYRWERLGALAPVDYTDYDPGTGVSIVPIPPLPANSVYTTVWRSVVLAIGLNAYYPAIVPRVVGENGNPGNLPGTPLGAAPP